MTYVYPFRMCSATATVVCFDFNGKRPRVLIAQRGDNVWAHPGKDSVVGGFMEARFTRQQDQIEMYRARLGARQALGWKQDKSVSEYHDGETVEMCAVREMYEELGVIITEDQLNLFKVMSDWRSDTRAHVVNVCSWVALTVEQIACLQAGDDLKSFRWEYVDDLPEMDMAFNHEVVLDLAIKNATPTINAIKRDQARDRDPFSDADYFESGYCT